MASDFDAIVVGSGISGGWAAKELTEHGLKVLLLERGRHVTHRQDYVTEGKGNWELPYRGQIPEAEVESDYWVQKLCYAFNDFTRHFFVNDRKHAYQTPAEKPFSWIRGYHLGGRSLQWHRQCYRWSDIDFEANLKDGHGVDWPIRYRDISPWYDYVETFAGISGSVEGLPQLPDGQFQPAFEMNCVEKEVKARMEAAFPDRNLIIGRAAHLTEPTEEQKALGRGQCMNRNECQRGCSFGAYFSSLSATLPAAERTRNLTTITDAIVDKVDYDAGSGRVSGVSVVDAKTKEGRSYSGKIVFLCASTLGTAQIMLNSTSESFPNGLANSSGTLGRYLMDHIGGSTSTGIFEGHTDKYHSPRRPNECYVPRFRNVAEQDERFLRGFGYQGGAKRLDWQRGTAGAGIGANLKAKLRQPGPWQFAIEGFGEMLPDGRNRVWLDERRRDEWGIPILHIDCEHRENEKAMIQVMAEDAGEMMKAAGLSNIDTQAQLAPPGLLIHEMGTARMGRDPATSVLNQHNQAHDIPNLFVTDGSAMTSSACQNPSLTYMALTARASATAVEMLSDGTI
ncbi:MAG: GMC family oxidoreductase [Gammaproteobacteria bacterium]|nr:GMC family oxidoreductase [Gammaproteobacteria bacterium]